MTRADRPRSWTHAAIRAAIRVAAIRGVTIVALLFGALACAPGNAPAPGGNAPATRPGANATSTTDNTGDGATTPGRVDFAALQRQLAEQARFERRYLQNVRPLTSTAWHARAGEAYFSPDGRTIVYQATPKDFPFYVIYTLDLTSPEATPQRVSPRVGDTTCAWFMPDGRLLFASTHEDPLAEQKRVWALPDFEKLKPYYMGRIHRRPVPYHWSFDPYMEIYAGARDGTKLTPLVRAAGYDAEGSTDAAGTRLVFCSERTGDFEIWTKNLATGKLRRISYSPGYDGGPFYSPDGTKIVWRADPGEQEGNFQLFLADLTSADPEYPQRPAVRQLTDRPWMHWCPYWHPDGRRLVYTSTRDGHYNYELWLLDLETERETRLTYSMGFDGLPVFSPDGRRLMWTSRRGDGSSQIWIADFTDPATLEPAPGEPDRDLPIATDRGH